MGTDLVICGMKNTNNLVALLSIMSCVIEWACKAVTIFIPDFSEFARIKSTKYLRNI